MANIKYPNKTSKNFWENLERPIKVLAPMAGYTDSAFRLLCREYGADVVMTELISADAIAYGKFRVSMIKGQVKVISNKNQSTAELLSFYEAERPIVVQLFGKYPEKFASATKWISDNLKPDGIDINMGCPAKKVVGSGHGGALMKNHDLAIEILKAVKENTTLPVSVKTRLGWENDDEILEFGPKLFEAGADALIIHGRTYKDGFKGEARWENIFKLKEVVGDKVVIGNGDIGARHKVQDTTTKQIPNSKLAKYQNDLRTTNSKLLTANLNGFAIGRAAFGKPWIFSKKAPASRTGRDNRIHPPAGRAGITDLKELILRHANLVFETKGEHGIVEFRKHLLAYLKGFVNSKELRIQATGIKSIKDVKEVILGIKE